MNLTYVKHSMITPLQKSRQSRVGKEGDGNNLGLGKPMLRPIEY